MQQILVIYQLQEQGWLWSSFIKNSWIICWWRHTISDNNGIDFVTIASTGNATDFGDLTGTYQGATWCSSTRGLELVVLEVQSLLLQYDNVIEYITIAQQEMLLILVI